MRALRVGPRWSAQAIRRGARCISVTPSLRKGGRKGAQHSVGDSLVSLAKRRGFMFPASDIYGGYASAWDYGPLGSQMKKNIQDAWWQDFVQARLDCVGLDSSIIQSPKVWQSSGHIDNFVDPLVDCKSCKQRFRVDTLLEDILERKGVADAAGVVGNMELGELGDAMKEHGVVCKNCGADDWTEPRHFNLMFRTFLGPNETAAAETYLRPETAQGAYIHFHNVCTTTRRKLPFGIGQVGKAFRNEISPGQFMFRAREFDMMELQYMTPPEESTEWHSYWVDFCHKWLVAHGLSEDNVRRRVYSESELAHYSLATTDLEYKYWFGWGELWGIANRGSYDLERHTEGSGLDLRFKDPTTQESQYPHVVEPAIGLGRLLLAVLNEAYTEEVWEGKNGKTLSRNLLKFHERFAPVSATVLPLLKRQPFVDYATQLHAKLASLGGVIDFDITGSIGKRYRRQDEIGTPLCITVDQDSLDNNTVTLRCRDSMEQVRLHVDELTASGPVKRSRFEDQFRLQAEQNKS